jgi:hypothetical protein
MYSVWITVDHYGFSYSRTFNTNNPMLIILFVIAHLQDSPRRHVVVQMSEDHFYSQEYGIDYTAWNEWEFINVFGVE